MVQKHPQGDGEGLVLDCITTKIGLAPFFAALEGLLADGGFKAAAEGPIATRPAMRVALPPPVTDEDGQSNTMLTKTCSLLTSVL